MLNKARNYKYVLAGLVVLAFAFATVGATSAKGFERWPVFNLDGEDYYFAGAPDGPNGEIDVPGHSWVIAGPNQVIAKHYNTDHLVRLAGGRQTRRMVNYSTLHTSSLTSGRPKRPLLTLPRVMCITMNSSV